MHWVSCTDVEVLLGVMEQLAPTDPRRHEILRALERCVDVYDIDGEVQAARGMLKDALSAPAARTAHRISAVGHAHIDSAWLWPVAETIRKCARTFSNMAALGERYPELVFACSQAQQWWWMKEKYPVVFERMKGQVKAGQVVPVGGMWVESDTNVTGAESLARQLVFGKRFFMSELGVETEERVAPGLLRVFARPPAAHLALGVSLVPHPEDFVERDEPVPAPHLLVGGHRRQPCFHPFPARGHLQRRARAFRAGQAARNYAEPGRGSRSLVPFGYGDGGGGPTREMMERARRMADLDGSRKVVVEPPSKFFAAAEAEYTNAPVWSGELYLELHRGTLTSQVEIKQGNRRCENLLREAELWSTTALVAGRAPYPYDELEEIWRDVLLNQFHDILPGSSIAMVNDEAIASHIRSAGRLEDIIDRAITSLSSQQRTRPGRRRRARQRCGADSLQRRAARAERGAGVVPARWRLRRGRPGSPTPTLANDLIRVELDADGHIMSLVDRVAGRRGHPPRHSWQRPAAPSRCAQ